MALNPPIVADDEGQSDSESPHVSPPAMPQHGQTAAGATQRYVPPGRRPGAAQSPAPGSALGVERWTRGQQLPQRTAPTWTTTPQPGPTSIQWPDPGQQLSYNEVTQRLRLTNTSSYSHNRFNYCPGVMIRTMHFEEGILGMDDNQCSDITTTFPSGQEYTHRVNPKYRYFIIVHCYETLSFTAVPVLTNSRQGLRHHFEAEKRGWVAVECLNEQSATRDVGIPEHNRTCNGSLLIGNIVGPRGRDFTWSAESCCFFAYPTSFRYDKKVAFVGYLTEASRKHLLDLYYGYLDTKQDGIAQLPTVPTQTDEQDLVAERDRLITANARLQAEKTTLTQEAGEKVATIAQLRAQMEAMRAPPRTPPAARTGMTTRSSGGGGNSRSPKRSREDDGPSSEGSPSRRRRA